MCFLTLYYRLSSINVQTRYNECTNKVQSSKMLPFVCIWFTFVHFYRCLLHCVLYSVKNNIDKSQLIDLGKCKTSFLVCNRCNAFCMLLFGTIAFCVRTSGSLVWNKLICKVTTSQPVCVFCVCSVLEKQMFLCTLEYDYTNTNTSITKKAQGLNAPFEILGMLLNVGIFAA